MGNNHSTLNVHRRQSLVREEFMFPELDCETDEEYEVYHIEVELQPLPSNIHDSTHVCVDEYTQEILSWEEDGAHAGERGRCLCCENDKGAGSRYSQSESDDANFCIKWNVYKEESCSEDIRETQTHTPSQKNCHHIICRETSCSPTVHELEGRRARSDLYGLYGKGLAKTYKPCYEMPEESVSDKMQETQQQPCRAKALPEDAPDLSDFFSPTTLEMASSPNHQRECAVDFAAVSSHNWTDQRSTAAILGARPKVMTSRAKPDQDRLSRHKDGVNQRRKSCSIPVSSTSATTMHSKTLDSSRKRKFSLKDEPGWIPNPLDSDSDSDDFEDSGVFSDYTGSPRMSTSPPSCLDWVSRAKAKMHPTLTGRRRHNSEPVPITSASTASPSQLHTATVSQVNTSGLSPNIESRKKGGSRWKLMSLSWKEGKTRKDDDLVQEVSPQDEDDLSEQLKWLAMSDSQLSQEAESSPENEVGPNFSETSPNTNDVYTEPEARYSQSSEDVSKRRASRFDGELELDWLCEPEWNNLELELFWSVLRPHLEHLLQPEDSDLLPEPCEAVCHMDAADPKMLDRCLLHVQWHIWKGNYCQAVADFRAIRRHFLCCSQSHLIESGLRDDLENLRLIFQRKRPSRFRLWI